MPGGVYGVEKSTNKVTTYKPSSSGSSGSSGSSSGKTSVPTVPDRYDYTRNPIAESTQNATNKTLADRIKDGIKKTAGNILSGVLGAVSSVLESTILNQAANIAQAFGAEKVKYDGFAYNINKGIKSLAADEKWYNSGRTVGNAFSVVMGAIAVVDGIQKVVVGIGESAIGSAIVYDAYNNYKNGIHNVERLNNSSHQSSILNECVPQKAYDILEQIESKNGTPPKGYKGGKIFKNDDGKLPEGIIYREYDVNAHVQGRNRGTERIIIGNDGSAWYTKDHYGSFVRIK